MRRRSLRLLSPNLCLNSDGDTGAFFRVKNYRRELFCPKTLGLERAGIVPPSYFLEGTLRVKRDFHAMLFVEEYRIKYYESENPNHNLPITLLYFRILVVEKLKEIVAFNI